MLTLHGQSRRTQRGVTLFITLIALVVMTLAGIALVRSIDTGTLISGNISFRQSGVLSGDKGIETGLSWLTSTSASTLYADSATNGYAAVDPCPANPTLCQDEAAFYQGLYEAGSMKTLPADAANNTVSYIIHRMCANSGSPTAVGTFCVTSASLSGTSGGSQSAGGIGITAPAQVYYRITARVAGPKNTVTYTQAVVAM